jgi:hypothetical protein
MYVRRPRADRLFQGFGLPLRKLSFENSKQDRRQVAFSTVEAHRKRYPPIKLIIPLPNKAIILSGKLTF